MFCSCGRWSRSIWNWSGAEDSNGNTINYTINIYSPGGQKLAAYTVTPSLYLAGGNTNSPYIEISLARSDQYFGGRRLAVMDQLGSVVENFGSQVQGYYPWGEPKGTVNPQDTWNFATYWADSFTGLDYANNRYYSNITGSFITPDSGKGAKAGDPQSWNRYTYTRGDPVNRADPHGTDDCEADACLWNWGDPFDGLWDTSGPSYGYACAFGFMAGCSLDQMSNASGGGSPAEATITPLVAPGTTQNQQQALDAGIDNAWDHIFSNPDCASFLTGNQNPGQYFANLGQLANMLTNTTYTFAQLDPGTAAQTNQEGGNQVTINTSGSFFSQPLLAPVVGVKMPDPGLGLPVGTLFSNIATLDALILLHELGHETGVLPAEGGSQAQNGANSAAILSNCFTKAANGVYQ
jgi:RHS repeat-associated protein